MVRICINRSFRIVLVVMFAVFVVFVVPEVLCMIGLLVHHTLSGVLCTLLITHLLPFSPGL